MTHMCACQGQQHGQRIMSEAMRNTTTQLVLIERRTTKPFRFGHVPVTQVVRVQTKSS